MAEAIKRSRLKLDRHPLKPLNEAKNEALRRFHGGIALSLVKSIRSKLKSFVVIFAAFWETRALPSGVLGPPSLFCILCFSFLVSVLI